jgi:uncharacterized protein YndB with AHSA1/START domain
VEVERIVDLDASSEAVWDAVCDPTGWLADSGWLEVRAGGQGRLVEDGVDREVRVDEVEDGHRLAYRWWSRDDGPAGASRVEITVVDMPQLTRVVIRESRPVVAASASASASSMSASASTSGVVIRWEVRLSCLAVRTALFVAA